MISQLTSTQQSTGLLTLNHATQRQVKKLGA